MKLFVAIFLLNSLTTFAGTTTYSNSEGCVVEKIQRRNGVTLVVDQNGQREFIGYANDYSFGDFAYCDEDSTDIDFSKGPQSTGVSISCSAHRNGHATTRGSVDLSIKDGDITDITIEGQVKGWFFWKQDTEIKCLNLVKQ